MISDTPFSTPDRDKDLSQGNCAKLYRSGWWFSKCGISNLNGINYNSDKAPLAKGIVFKDDKHGAQYSYPAVRMMIRPNHLAQQRYAKAKENEKLKRNKEHARRS